MIEIIKNWFPKVTYEWVAFDGITGNFCSSGLHTTERSKPKEDVWKELQIKIRKEAKDDSIFIYSLEICSSR